MLKTAAKKVAWVDRTASMVFGLALVMALVLGVATMAFAANGSNFVLGVLDNTATVVTKLTGDVPGAEALQVSNPNTVTGSTALSLNVDRGKRPMTVNSKAKVVNLNADQVDGKGAETFLGKTEKAADASKLDGKFASEFARANLFGQAVVTNRGDSSGPECILSEVRLFAGIQMPKNWAEAEGQLIGINQNQALFSLIGNNYGGDGEITFALPDLRGAEPKGAGPMAPSYGICLVGYYPG